MLTENYRTTPPNTFQFKNISKDLVFWFESIVYENNCRIEKKEWKSKYNSYVVYDYEPFCSDGFEINITVSGNNFQYIDFIKYLYDNKIKTLEYLQKCLN